MVAGHSYPQTILGQIERKFVQEASALEIFSVSIIDFWSNYRLRFSLSQGKILDALPNLICATDYSMKDELVKAGISKDRITVTGNPYLERLKDIKGDLAKQGKDSFRKNFRFEKDDIVIVFLSQPISIDSGKGKCGYDEDKIFKDVIRVLAGQKWADKVKVIWKPHPREKNKNIENQFSNIPLSIEEFKQGEIFELMAGSDLIIGAFTMLLVEAFLLGFCCISYQPNENNILKLPYKIKILKDSGSLEKFLNNKEFYTNQKDQTDQPSLISNSTEIIKNLILSHINH